MVALCIRPVLEGAMRHRFPKAFASNQWLGGMIEQVRNAQEGDLLCHAGGHIQELTEINDYSRHFHHDQNPDGWQTHPISDAQLESYVRRTIRFVSQPA